MPDLRKAVVTAWLQEREPSVATLGGGAVRPLEDDAEVRTALSNLGEALDDSLNRDASLLSARLREPLVQTRLRSVLVQLGPARLLGLLHWLTFSGLPAGEKVLAGLLEDEPDGTGVKLRAAVQDLHRQALLARIFSKDRLRILLNACQSQQPEAA